MDEQQGTRVKSFTLTTVPDKNHRMRVLLYCVAVLLLLIIGGGVGFLYGINMNSNNQLLINHSPYNSITITPTSLVSITPLKPTLSGNSQVTITSITPQSGVINTQVTIIGSGFTASGNWIKLNNGYISELSSRDGRTITFTIPRRIEGGCLYPPYPPLSPGALQCNAISEIPIIPGVYSLSIINRNNRSNTLNITVTGQ